MNGELIEYLDKKFNKIDEKFNKMEIELVDIGEDLKKAREERQRLGTEINETHNAVDGFIKVVDRLQQEFTVIKEDLKRVKDVIRDKLGVDLS